MAVLHILLDLQCSLLLLWLQLVSAQKPITASGVIAKPGCQDRCGNVSIPYPFGIGEGCFVNEYFEITSCNESVPMRNSVRISNISVLDGQMTVDNPVTSMCTQEFDTSIHSGKTSIGTGKFTVSTTKNKLISIGCNSRAYIYGYPSVGLQECSDCRRNEDITDGSCNGMGCCETSIPHGLTDTNVSLERRTPKDLMSFNPCSYAFIAEESSFMFSLSYLKDFKNNGSGTVPVVLDWAIGYETCDVAQGNMTSYACGTNAVCKSGNNIAAGYLCNCKPGYAGNPYLNSSSGGHCQDIDECQDKKLYDSRCARPGNVCKNTEGGYKCPCKQGYDTVNSDFEIYQGNDNILISDCRRRNSKKIVLSVSLGLVLLVVSLVVGIWLYWGYSKRKHMQVKEVFFKQNGGLILNRLLDEREEDIESSRNGRGGKKHRSIATIFTEKELSKATNNYDESHILGRGGFGTVYKGMLSDGTVVAIKKTKIVDRNQNEQFINEIAVLSQINHKNVVQLLGCCLESEVPLLVYEYVTNGTLHQHLHKVRANQTGCVTLSWENRLRIALEVAGALAYLHAEASIPIIHRDVKSSNVLLNDEYKAKVSDFGASRLIPGDQAHLSTVVQGTFGYLDPEYMLSSQLTEKSDVYSFGVLLVELLTGKAVFSPKRVKEERNLANLFLSVMKTNRLFTILDGNMVRYDNERVSSEDGRQQIQQMAELAQKCLRMKGENRPTMKDVAVVLHGLMGMSSSYSGSIIDDEDTITNTVLSLESAESFCYTESIMEGR
ncbi:hypothetical protein MKX03_033030 [Papaver bracteatum]|nr:hypothetical protein MKX03_033030 [Papaver bracteatum]